MTPEWRGFDEDGAAGLSLCGLLLRRFPLLVFSIVSLSVNGLPPAGQNFRAAPCTPRTAVTEGKTSGLKETKTSAKICFYMFAENRKKDAGKGKKKSVRGVWRGMKGNPLLRALGFQGDINLCLVCKGYISA